MEFETKLLQQPLEKMMGKICKLIDHELISIPSNKRPNKIHSLFMSAQDKD